MKNLFWKLLVIGLFFIIASCVNDPSAEKQSADDDGKTTSKTSLSSVINDPNVKDGDTIDLSKPEYKDITDFTATINKSLIIKNGYSLKDAAITVTADGVVLDNIHGVSVTTDKSISISDSELSGLTISSSSQNGSGNNADTAPVIVILNSSAANITLDIANTIMSLSGSASAEQVTVTSSVTLTVSGANVNVSNITASVAVTVLLENNASIDIENDNISKVTVTNPVLTGLKLKCFDSEIYDDQIPFGGLIVIGEYTQDGQTFSKPITDWTIKVDNAAWTAGTKLSAGIHSVVISAGDKTAVKTLIVKEHSDSGNNSGDTKPTPVVSGLTKDVSLKILFQLLYEKIFQSGTFYDVTFDAANATFTASLSADQSVDNLDSSDSFEGNFFYYNKSMFLETTKISGESLSEKRYYIIGVPEEIQNDTDLPLVYVCQIGAFVYEQEKSAFELVQSGTAKAVKNVTTASLSGSRWVSNHCLIMWGTTGANSSKIYNGCEFDFGGINMSFTDTTIDVSIGISISMSGAIINGSTVTVESENSYYYSTVTIKFYQDDTAELFIQEMIKDNSGNESGGVMRGTQRSTLRQATDADLLVNKTYKLADTNKAADYKYIDFYSGVFEIRNEYYNKIFGQGIYSISGQTVTLTFSDDASLLSEFQYVGGRPNGQSNSNGHPYNEDYEYYDYDCRDTTDDKILSGTVTGTLNEDLSSLTLSGTVTTESNESAILSLMSPLYMTGTYTTTSIKLNGEDVTSDFAYTLSFTNESFSMSSKDNLSRYEGYYYGTDNKLFMRHLSGGRAKSSEYYLLKDIAVTYTDGSSFTVTANAYANNELIGVQKMIFCRED